MIRISSGSTNERVYAGDQSDRHADEVGEQRRRARQRDHRAPSPEHAAEDVSARKSVPSSGWLLGC